MESQKGAVVFTQNSLRGQYPQKFLKFNLYSDEFQCFMASCQWHKRAEVFLRLNIHLSSFKPPVIFVAIIINILRYQKKQYIKCAYFNIRPNYHFWGAAIDFLSVQGFQRPFHILSPNPTLKWLASLCQLHRQPFACGSYSMTTMLYRYQGPPPWRQVISFQDRAAVCIGVLKAMPFHAKFLFRTFSSF